MKKTVHFLLLLSVVITTALAQAQQAPPKPETLIKWRQSAFQVIAWNNARVKTSLEGQYQKDDVAKASATIAAIANSGLGALFGPGTEQGKGWHDTSTKPELFKDPKRAAELFGNFNREANELARVAALGDPAAVKEQFGKLGKTCKACHDDFKAKD
jgi:cytochrome c556